jgi:dihydrodipicolinate reductase
MSEDVFTDMLEDDFDDEVIENINQIKMDKPSNTVMAIICSLAANAWQENKNWEDAIETHGYMAEMEHCNKQKEDLKLLDEWIDKVEAE